MARVAEQVAAASKISGFNLSFPGENQGGSIKKGIRCNICQVCVHAAAAWGEEP